MPSDATANELFAGSRLIRLAIVGLLQHFGDDGQMSSQRVGQFRQDGGL